VGTVRVIGYRSQRTLAAPAELSGVGLITGTRVRVRFLPAPANRGIVFRRIDLAGSPAVAAHPSAITNTNRRTTLGPANTGVSLTEHVLSALAGLRIDNCMIEVDGIEPPGLDGSAGHFVDLLLNAGSVLQSAQRPIYATNTTILATGADTTIALHPAEGAGLRATYILDYGHGSPIPRQMYSLDVTPENYVREVSRCRTFCTEPEAKAMKAIGLAPHLEFADTVVFGSGGPIDNALRFADEPARHKVLDLIGDLALCGFDLAGHVVAYRSGHTLNAELSRKLVAEVESVRRAA
jgi:UDP-3-O-[3-hydroxymyristoyl] N-acetylglucosamine deacetylase